MTMRITRAAIQETESDLLEVQWAKGRRTAREALGALARKWAWTPLALLVACAASAPPRAAVATTGAPALTNADEGYGYTFDTDSAKEAAAGQRSAPSLLNADGRIPPETIQATVRDHFGAIGTCYQAGLEKDPKLAGIVAVKFVFGGDGIVKDAADERSTLPDKDVIACVVGELRKLTYPKGPPGDVTVVYPIQLSP